MLLAARKLCLISGRRFMKGMLSTRARGPLVFAPITHRKFSSDKLTEVGVISRERQILEDIYQVPPEGELYFFLMDGVTDDIKKRKMSDYFALVKGIREKFPSQFQRLPKRVLTDDSPTFKTSLINSWKDLPTLEELHEDVVRVCLEFDKIDASKFTLDGHFTKDYGFDSLDQIDLMINIEELYDLEIPDKEADELMTAQMIIDYLIDLLPRVYPPAQYAGDLQQQPLPPELDDRY